MSLKRLIIVFWGKQNSNIRNRNVLLNKLIVVIFSFVFSFLVKVKLGQVGVGFENVTTHSSSLFEVIYTVFVPIEARRASAGISPSETVLISRENNYCGRNTTYPLYITSFSLLYD